DDGENSSETLPCSQTLRESSGQGAGSTLPNRPTGRGRNGGRADPGLWRAGEPHSRSEPLMTKPRPRREDRQPGETFRDAVGSYLCSYGLRILKDRHKAEHEPLTGTPAEVEM